MGHTFRTCKEHVTFPYYVYITFVENYMEENRAPTTIYSFWTMLYKRWMKTKTQQNIDEWMIQITYQLFQYHKRAFLH